MSCGLILVRHGATAWNREGRYQGHADPPLCQEGRAQARRLARSLKAVRLDAVYSSDLCRALATAAPLAAARGLSVQTDRRLRELDFGAWDGRRVEEVIAAETEHWESWWADPVRLAPPGGEEVPALWERLGQALREIRLRHAGGMVVVVTHGGPLRLILARLATGRLHPPLEAGVPNGGWLLVTPPSAAALLADD